VWDRQFNEGCPTVIFQMIYTCALADDVTPSDLDEIARSSRLRNISQGLTGILLCKDGSVLQVLEGARETVEAVYSRITMDPRVTNALVLIRRETTAREFPNWSMGYRNVDDTDAAFELCSRSLPEAIPQDSSPELGMLSRTFARVNGLV